MKKILIAGIGNIFHGDDAFGCEVIRMLSPDALPEGVTVMDFGIRSYDLAYALTDGYDAVILVDAASRGQPPGTLFVMEPDTDMPESFKGVSADPHALNPVSVIQMAQSFGGIKGKLYLIGCEPAVLEGDEITLSETVRDSIPAAITMIKSLVKDITESRIKTEGRLQTA